MKTVLKLHIIIFFLISGYVSAAPINKGLNETEYKLESLKGKQTNQSENFSIQAEIKSGLDQTINKLITQKYASFYNAPEFTGEFQYYFSAQFLLPDIGTKQRFTLHLIM